MASDSVSEVRHRLQRWCSGSGYGYSEVARRCGLRVHQVEDFARGKTASEPVIKAICDHLPIGLRYLPSRIVPS